MHGGSAYVLEDKHRLPPPVVFGLSEFCFPIVTIKIRPICVGALQPFGPENEAAMYLNP
jgi:hypothetical protein